ncbi:hypothetical protein, partial [Pseudomonas sp. GM102]|uniref:hypothetical protein n=1 Tax=Pseudomonas sp. GM102 TaxID=1144321 RepID=UPI001EE653B8
DFHLQVTSEATTAKLVALARNAPCLAHPKEKARSECGPFFDFWLVWCSSGPLRGQASLLQVLCYSPIM